MHTMFYSRLMGRHIYKTSPRSSSPDSSWIVYGTTFSPSGRHRTLQILTSSVFFILLILCNPLFIGSQRIGGYYDHILYTIYYDTYSLFCESRLYSLFIYPQYSTSTTLYSYNSTYDMVFVYIFTIVSELYYFETIIYIITISRYTILRILLIVYLRRHYSSANKVTVSHQQ